jgi:AraC-like DNA-binding protein
MCKFSKEIKMMMYIKNMVCNRCITAVSAEIEKLNIMPLHISLGEVELKDELSSQQISQLQINLNHLGFELLTDGRKKLIEKIKNYIIQHVHYNEIDEKKKFSVLLSEKLNKDYSALSNLFSQVEGITIEKYIINQKIEKAKELLVYDELNLSEIAFKLGYSSVAHISAQFKKITGLSPSDFRKLHNKNRKPLDKI